MLPTAQLSAGAGSGSSGQQAQSEYKFRPGMFAAMAAVHLGALLALFPYYFTWAGLILAAISTWAILSLGVSMTYHRLLTHRSWQALPGLRTVLLTLSAFGLEGGPLTWTATHRLHHRESDHQDDPHSPMVSFLWAHLFWMFYTVPRIADQEEVRRLIPDLIDDRELKFFERNFVLFWIAFALVTFIAGFLIGGAGAEGLRLGLSLVVWGTLLRTVWVWHCTWFVNSLTHLYGYRNFNTEDESRNLWWVALLTFGEGWHNNHHAVAGNPSFTQKWWELDVTWIALRIFQRLGWASKVNETHRLDGSGTVRDYSGKVAARSPRLLRRRERLAQDLIRRYSSSSTRLVEALRSRRSAMREAAAMAVGQLSMPSQLETEALRQLLNDRSANVRQAAIEAVKQLESANSPLNKAI